MTDAIVIVLVCIALAAWLVMVVSALRMLRHRRRSVLWLAMNGWAFFAGDAFAPEVGRDRRRLVLSFALFMLAIVAVIAAAAIRLG